MPHASSFGALGALLLAFLPARARAQDTGDDGIGLGVGLGWASAYIWRGANVFSDGSLADQDMLLGPSVTWAAGDTGLFLGWWGGFQLTGGNRRENVAAGVGAEQNLMVGFGRELPHDLSLEVGLTGFAYPLATAEAAGQSCPFYLDASAGLGWAGPVDLGVRLSWFWATQAALTGLEHLYLNPSVGRTWEVSERVGLEATLGLGYKLSFSGAFTENRWDVALLAGAPITLGRGGWLRPGLGASWTDQTGGGFAGGLVGWGALDVGVDL